MPELPFGCSGHISLPTADAGGIGHGARREPVRNTTFTFYLLPFHFLLFTFSFTPAGHLQSAVMNNPRTPQSPGLPVRRIVSGGQSGVDRGALDAAIQLDIPHGGWCPRGRLAEDGTIPERYRLQETKSPKYHHRTRKNVLDGDATLILHRGPLSGGTGLTRKFAERHGKPLLLVDLSDDPQVAPVRAWLAEHSVATLNIAGPRESSAPGIADEARRFVLRLLAPGEPARERL
jgi:hypothetical protein